MSMFHGESVLVPGALTAYRTWAFDGAAVRAVNWSEVVWGPDMPAICLADVDHGAPVVECQCGIYAWYHPADTAQRASDVFGVVEITGRAVLGTRGLRASRARVCGVTSANPKHDAALERWCELVGVRYFRMARELVAAYPPADVSELVAQEVPVALNNPAWVTAHRGIRTRFVRGVPSPYDVAANIAGGIRSVLAYLGLVEDKAVAR